MAQATTTHTGTSRGKDAHMASNTFIVSGMANDADDLYARCERRLPDGFRLTGRKGVKSARHLLFTVEVENTGGDVNDCWVMLTSYGMSPAAELGSHWESELVPQ